MQLLTAACDDVLRSSDIDFEGRDSPWCIPSHRSTNRCPLEHACNGQSHVNADLRDLSTSIGCTGMENSLRNNLNLHQAVEPSILRCQTPNSLICSQSQEGKAINERQNVPLFNDIHETRHHQPIFSRTPQRHSNG